MYVIRSWKKAFRKIVLSQPLWNCNSEMVWWHDNTYFFSYRPEKRSYFWAVAQSASALSLANLTLSTHLGILEGERHTPWKCLNLSGHKMVFLAGESTPIFWARTKPSTFKKNGSFFCSQSSVATAICPNLKMWHARITRNWTKSWDAMLNSLLILELSFYDFLRY